MGAAQAQDRYIRMPEEPDQKGINIAEADKGYWCAVDVSGGYTLMDTHDNIGMVSAAFTNGYRFNQYIKLGAGLGLMYYPKGDDVRRRSSNFALPVFLNARGNILSDQTRHAVPYWSYNIGMTFPDGFFMTPTVGMRIGEKRSAFLIGISYTLRQLKSKPNRPDFYSGAFVKLGYEY